MSNKFVLSLIIFSFLAPLHASADKKLEKEEVNLFKIEIDRQNGNCKIVTYLSNWQNQDKCNDEKAAHMTRDAEEQYSNTNGNLDSKTGEAIQTKTRWSLDMSDGQYKVNWAYNCLAKTQAEVEKRLTLCK